ncbi:hypothetical protein LJR245_006607 [Rhizobium leguminosarum]|uniref:hypothetical protein n=1 Tax=Rhizobium leguminosarum TaxID=384 RepID=UPI003ECF683E
MAIEASSEQTREPRIRLGMVGGGAGAFIGAVHRIAARIDDQFDLIAGALSASPEKAIASGRDLGLDPSRTYSSYREMAIREAKLKNGIEAVAKRVYGTKGGLEWTQKDPNYLWYTPFGEPKRLITRNGAGSGAAAARVSRIPSGHPEGYLEAFATIYTEAARAINAAKKGVAVDPAVVYPTVDDGVKGVAFVDACVASSKRNGAWVEV